MQNSDKRSEKDPRIVDDKKNQINLKRQYAEGIQNRIKESLQTGDFNLPKDAIFAELYEQSSLPLGGQLVYENAYILAINSKKNGRMYLVLDKEAGAIATIGADGKISLTSLGREKYKTGEPGKQSPTQKSLIDLNKEYYLNLELEIEQEKEALKKDDINIEKREIRTKTNKEPKNKEDELKRNIAKGLKIPSQKIDSIIKFEDRESISRIINKNVKMNSEIFMIKYDNNKFKIVEKDGDEVKALTGIEVTELSYKLLEELNLERRKTATIGAEEIEAYSSQRGIYNLLEVKRAASPNAGAMLEYDFDGDVTSENLPPKIEQISNCIQESKLIYEIMEKEEQLVHIEEEIAMSNEGTGLEELQNKRASLLNELKSLKELNSKEEKQEDIEKVPWENTRRH